MSDEQQPTPWRRRDFLRASARTTAAVTLGSAFPWTSALAAERGPARARMTGAESAAQRANTQIMEQLVLRAVDTARSAGARYAEARVTRTVTETMGTGMFGGDDEHLAIGIRVLIDGAWGFAASTYWELDEATDLAREAVEQARINAKLFSHEVDLGSYPVVKGQWATPIRLDPFEIPIEEKIDFTRSFSGRLPRHTPGRVYMVGLSNVICTRQERMVATSENSLFAQTLYTSEGLFSLSVRAQKPGAPNEEVAAVSGRGINPTAAGWELFYDAKLGDQIPGLIDELEHKLFLPHKPVDVGRYDVVMPASVISGLVASTFGDATQIDRALGMEANARGTSYLGPDPMDYLGTQLGSPLLHVSANRSLPGGLATVKWDDEGVEPDTFPIIEAGRFVDYQTTREQAAWLAPWYQQRGQAIRSHGCAVAVTAGDFTMQHTPNLQIKPGTGSTTFEEMIKNTERGIAIMQGGVGTDFQSRTGYIGGVMREVVKGKLGAVLDGAYILFNSLQVWKGLTELGGPGSVELGGARSIKGQPQQMTEYSIQAVPGRMKELTVVDVLRK